MKNKHEFHLIDGLFTGEEVDELISSLIQYKINFHDHKIFSSEIRFGVKDKKSVERKLELMEIKEKLRVFIKDGAVHQKSYKITTKVIMEEVVSSGNVLT